MFFVLKIKIFVYIDESHFVLKLMLSFEKVKKKKKISLSLSYLMIKSLDSSAKAYKRTIGLE